MRFVRQCRAVRFTDRSSATPPVLRVYIFRFVDTGRVGKLVPTMDEASPPCAPQIETNCRFLTRRENEVSVSMCVLLRTYICMYICIYIYISTIAHQPTAGHGSMFVRTWASLALSQSFPQLKVAAGSIVVFISNLFSWPTPSRNPSSLCRDLQNDPFTFCEAVERAPYAF